MVRYGMLGYVLGLADILDIMWLAFMWGDVMADALVSFMYVMCTADVLLICVGLLLWWKGWL